MTAVAALMSVMVALSAIAGTPATAPPALGAMTGALPETPRLRTFGVTDGLPSSTIYSLAMDQQGYLWVATSDGLARFDGVEFEIHRHRPDDPNSLRGNSVQIVHVDALDRVWIGVENGGLSRLDADRRVWRHFNRDTVPDMRVDEIWAIASDAEGRVWLGTYEGGVYRFDGESVLQRWSTDAEGPSGLPSDIITELAVAGDGTVWAATFGGAARWRGGTFSAIDPSRLSGTLITALYPDRDGGIWLGSNRGLDYMDPHDVVQALPWAARSALRNVRTVLRDREDGYWFGAYNGLFRIKRQFSIDRRRAVLEQVGPWNTRALAEDREGGLWVGTANGLHYLSPGWRQFAVFDNRSLYHDESLTWRPWSADVSADGTVWVAGERAGLLRLDPNSGKSEVVPLPKLSDAVGVSLQSLLAHSDGSIWMGSLASLIRYLPDAGSFRVRGMGDEGDAIPSPGFVDLLLEDTQGRVWSSGAGGIQVRAADGQLLDTIAIDSSRGLGSGGVEQLSLGPDGAVWLAAGNGLLRWDAEERVFVPVPGSPDSRVYGFDARDEDLWLAQMGVLRRYRWDGEGLREIARIDQSHGLVAVEPGGVVLDRHGEVWLTTLRGLFRYSPITGRMRHYSQRDGLPSREFVNRPPRVTAEGRVLAGVMSGLVMFDPHRIPALSVTSPEPPSLALASVWVRRASGELPLDPRGGLRLAPGDRDLRVVARLISFVDASAHRFEFELLGYDTEPVPVGASGERIFPALAPGQYLLRVRGVNAEGVWSWPVELPILAEPYWWQSTWARTGYILVGLALLALSAVAYRRRVDRRYALELARQRQAMAERASDAKSRFLANLGHEVRTPMTGVLGMSELLLAGDLDRDQRAQVQAIAQAGRHLLRLVNDALDLARIEAGRLRLDHEPFEPHALLYEVDALLAPLAERKGLSLHSELDPDLPRRVLGDVHRLRQVLLNLGHNAIKFTERGRIDLRAERFREEWLRFEVSDTGPGLTPAQQRQVFERFEQVHDTRTATSREYAGSGLGLSICSELVAAMSGLIRIDSTLGRGTTFSVELPLPETSDYSEPEDDAVPRDGDASLAMSMESRGVDVLVVEDDATVAEVVQGLLKAGGHRVVHARHALEGLAALDRQRFDLALLDLDLPGLSGQDMARLLRERGETLPLLAITARADAEAERDARAAGMDAFLRKPVTGEALTSAVFSLLAETPRERAGV